MPERRRRLRRISEEARPADWTGLCRPTCKPGHRQPGRNGGRSYCPAAGDYRNEDMVAEEPVPNLCLAFVDECAKPSCRQPKPHGTHGAIDCASGAERAGIETCYAGFDPHEQTLALFEGSES